MLATLMAASLVGAAIAQQTDTVVAVPANARVAVHGIGGEVTVRTWDRNQVRIQTREARSGRVTVTVTGSRVLISPDRRRGASHGGDLALTLPATASVEIDGALTDVDIDGVRGEITVSTAQGDIAVRGGGQFVRLRTMQGQVVLTDAAGRMDLNSVNGDIEVRSVRGEITASTVNGEITLEGVTSDAVEVNSTNGDILYSGTLSSRGRYVFGTHGGDVTLVVPATTSATVSVSSFSGEVESEFPLTLRGTEAGGKRFTFTLGAGEGRIEVGSFSGTVYLRRP